MSKSLKLYKSTFEHEWISLWSHKDLPSKMNVSFHLGFRFFLLMFVVSLCFLSGSSMIFTYGSLVPEKSLAAKSVARITFRVRIISLVSYPRLNWSRPSLSWPDVLPPVPPASFEVSSQLFEVASSASLEDEVSGSEEVFEMPTGLLLPLRPSAPWDKRKVANEAR